MFSRVRFPLSPIWGHLEAFSGTKAVVAFYNKGKRKTVKVPLSDTVHFIDLSKL